jgi:hypothetical protein
VGPTEGLAKFRECAGIALGEPRARNALEPARAFERLPDVRRMTEALAVPEATR